MIASLLNYASRTFGMNRPGYLHTEMFERFFFIQEFRKLTSIASPLILASLVTMSISITDVIMIGQLGPVELAAGAAASDFYSIFFYLAAGVIAAISPLVAHARGRKQFRVIKSITLMGLAAGLLCGIPASYFVYHAPVILELLGVQHDITTTAVPYSQMMAIAIFPMLAMMSLHHFLSAHGKTRIILYVTALALPINMLGNYLLLYGNWGFPKLGLAGAGIATAITGTFMFSAMLVYVLSQRHFRRYFIIPPPVTSNFNQLMEIFKIGLPIGVSHVGEMGVFLFATVTMGIFGAEVLAAHTLALRAAGVFYAVPMGYAQASTVRIGFLSGQGDPVAVRNAVKTIATLSVAFGVLLMLCILLVRDEIPRIALDPAQITSIVVAESSVFLLLLALMQPTVNIGTICAGVLRGFKDTRYPMIYSLASYWGLGFAGAMALAFWLGMNGTGIWVGLLTATAVFSVLILFRLTKHYRYNLANQFT